MSDAARLDQLLSNLVTNAVTHGARSTSITIKAEEEKGHFMLSVSNAVEAIPPDILPVLFEPFERSGRESSLHGLRLGLNIADQIAKAHNGKLSVISDQVATTFTRHIPSKPMNRLHF